MNYILWNVRGAGARSFPSLIRGIAHSFKVDFVALFETRCSGSKADRIATLMGFPNFKIIDADGFKGGIWCLWSDKFRHVEVRGSTNQFMHIRFTGQLGQVWEMTFVYGSPNIVLRRTLWHDLMNLRRAVHVPWCLGGDFNATLASEERCSWRSTRGSDREFCSFVDDADLHDLGFVGPPFTWKRTGVESRLDRVLGSTTWQETFPDAVVKHLNWYKSDHRPLLLQLEGCAMMTRVDRPFRFLAAWVLDERFSSFVSGNWSSDLAWAENIDQFTMACKQWNRQVFGHTNTRKRQLLGRLNGITRTESRFGLTMELEELQRSLWQQLEEVLTQESLIWAQKSRSDWVVDGDRNTRYFHSRANGRRKRNHIGALKGSDDVWVYDSDLIKEMTVSHFSTVFMEEQTRRSPLCCTFSFPDIDSAELSSLGRSITDMEIKHALFSMGALKAPGPDGLNALFYQNQWPVVERSVCEYVKSIWLSPAKVESVNDTLIVLIPKKDHPEVVKDFRPISLCNVIFKIITKVIANRIKVVLPKVISPHQCSFVPGRHSSDNIIVAQEVIHSMRNMRGKRGYMAIKIDLEKAYDRVNWAFLRDCLLDLKLPSALIDIILCCVSTPSMQLLWNGERAGSFSPSRGVRQGDPLSPYLFVICMERLAHLIQERIGRGDWRPINLNKGGPPISHLFFADDIVLFVEASEKQATEVRNCLDNFCMASGLKVNAAKTRVFFSKNVNHIRRTELSDTLGFQVTPDLGKYLGVPLHHKRVTTGSYQGIVDKVRNRLSGWKVNALSLAGRATLISSVTSAIPGYTMQTVSLPKVTCDNIEQQNRRFLWGSTAERRKTHLVAWDTVCVPKKMGGLGMKHLHRQNQAYMMKLGWGLIKRRDELWVKVVRSKYNCGDDILPSIDLTRRGSNAWSGIKKSWEKVLAGTVVDTESGVVRWRHDRHGEFNIKSAYQALSDLPVGEERSWQRIWKLQIMPRCKTFMWLALHDKLLTNAERARRGIGGDGSCSGCGAESESLVHVLRDCSDTKRLWLAVVDPLTRGRFFQLEVQPWIKQNIHRVHDRGKGGWCELFSTTCWLIWQRRNTRIFENISTSNESLIIRAKSIMSASSKARERLQGVNLNNHCVRLRGGAWVPPSPGWVKLNVDGACAGNRIASCGGILRDDSGMLKQGFMFRAEEPADSLRAELWAVLFGLKMCWDAGERRACLESDAEEVVTLLKNPIQRSHPDVLVIQEIKSMIGRDWEVLVSWIPREANMAADYVAKQALDTWPGLHQFHAAFGGLNTVLDKDKESVMYSSGFG